MPQSYYIQPGEAAGEAAHHGDNAAERILICIMALKDANHTAITHWERSIRDMARLVRLKHTAFIDT